MYTQKKKFNFKSIIAFIFTEEYVHKLIEFSGKKTPKIK